MAYIRAHQTTQKSKGKPVKRYEVVWREAHPTQHGKTRARQESYGTREQAEARRDALNNAKHTLGGTTALADAKKAGALTFGHYAQGWLAAQRVKAATNDKLRPETVDGYERRLAVYALPTFGGRPIGSITSTDCETYLAALVGRGMSPATLKHHWSVLRNVFVYAHRNNALASNPVDAVDYSGNSAARRNKRHHPLTAGEVAAVATSIGERYPVYELFTYFAAYTGLRAEELAGCENRDLEFKPSSHGVAADIHVRRAKKRRAGQWVEDALKTEKSARTVQLPSWLAARMADYLATEHERADEPTAPLWPNRAMGGSWRRGCPGSRGARLRRAGRPGRVLQEPVPARPRGRRAAREPTRYGDCARGPGRPLPRPSAYVRDLAVVRGRARDEGVKVVGAQHLHADARRVRRLDPEG